MTVSKAFASTDVEVGYGHRAHNPKRATLALEAPSRGGRYLPLDLILDGSRKGGTGSVASPPLPFALPYAAIGYNGTAGHVATYGHDWWKRKVQGPLLFHTITCTLGSQADHLVPASWSDLISTMLSNNEVGGPGARGMGFSY
jgi:hypothetical protein